jgi:hypothetical protein
MIRPLQVELKGGVDGTRKSVEKAAWVRAAET